MNLDNGLIRYDWIMMRFVTKTNILREMLLIMIMVLESIQIGMTGTWSLTVAGDW